MSNFWKRWVGRQVPRWIPCRSRIIELSDEYGVMPIVSASIIGCEPLRKLILHLSEDPFEPGCDLRAELALLGAVSRNCAPCVEALVFSANGDPFERVRVATAIHMAAANGKLLALRAILDMDRDRKATRVEDKYGLRPIHVAAIYGHVEAVRMLVRHDPAALVVKVWDPMPKRDRVVFEDPVFPVPSWIDLLQIYDTTNVPFWIFDDSAGCTAAHLAAANGHSIVLQELARLAYMAECGPSLSNPLNMSLRPYLHVLASAGECDSGNMRKCKGFDHSSVMLKMQQLALSEKHARTSSISNRQLLVYDEARSFVDTVIEKAVYLSPFASSESSFRERDLYNITVRGVLEAEDEFQYAPLFCAALSGSETSMRTLVKLGADVEKRGPQRRTVLHEAIFNKKPKLAAILVNEYGLDIEAQDEQGLTALHYAALTYEEGEDQVSELLNLGANIEARSFSQETPLFMSAVEGQRKQFIGLLKAGANLRAVCGLKDSCVPLVKIARQYLFSTLLDVLRDMTTLPTEITSTNAKMTDEDKVVILSECIKHGADDDVLRNIFKVLDVETIRGPDKNILWTFAKHSEKKSVNIARSMLKRGADVNYTGESGWTALHYAARSDAYKDFARLLINHGADVNTSSTDSNEESPLHFAAETKSPDLVRILLSAGASCSSRTRHVKQTPLHYATKSGCVNSVKALVEYGADVTALSSDGRTPLHFAVAGSFMEIAKILLDAGSSVDGRPNVRPFPLHAGCVPIFLPATIPLLLERGAFVDAPGRHSDTPVSLFARMRSEDFLCTLIEAEANINLRNKLGQDSFLSAAQSGILRNVAILVSHGAQLDSCDIRGRTALHLAAANGHSHVMRYLLRNGANILAVDLEGCTPMELAVHWQHMGTFRTLLRTENTGALDVLVKKTIFVADSPCQSDDDESEEGKAECEGQQRVTHADCEMDQARARCSICLLVLRNKDEVRTMRCGHIFHDSCIVSWLLSENGSQDMNCPLCRQPLTTPPEELIRQDLANGNDGEAQAG